MKSISLIATFQTSGPNSDQQHHQRQHDQADDAPAGGAGSGATPRPHGETLRSAPRAASAGG